MKQTINILPKITALTKDGLQVNVPSDDSILEMDYKGNFLLIKTWFVDKAVIDNVNQNIDPNSWELSLTEDNVNGQRFNVEQIIFRHWGEKPEIKIDSNSHRLKALVVNQ